MSNQLVKRLTAAAGSFAVLLASHASAFAQGCVMCKTSVAGSPEAAATAARINFGILVLLLPVVALFVSIFLMIYRYRNCYEVAEVERDERLLSILDSETDSAIL